MRVRCVANTGLAIPHKWIDDLGGYGRDSLFPLTIDGEYLVVALTLRQGTVWYYLLDDLKLDYPVWYPAVLFEVTDARLSRFWVFAFVNEGIRDGDAVLAFKQWAADPLGYYDRLTDGESVATSLFVSYLEKMEFEFAPSDLAAVGEDLGDGWTLCPRCHEAWRNSAVGELLRCPSCSAKLRNPRVMGH